MTISQMPHGATPNELHCSPAGAQRGDKFAVPHTIIGKRLGQALLPSRPFTDEQTNEDTLTTSLENIDNISFWQLLKLMEYFYSNDDTVNDSEAEDLSPDNYFFENLRQK
ncbi:uncharacterized protein LOC144448623 [Glandiceps talaboti]